MQHDEQRAKADNVSKRINEVQTAREEVQKALTKLAGQMKHAKQQYVEAKKLLPMLQALILTREQLDELESRLSQSLPPQLPISASSECGKDLEDNSRPGDQPKHHIEVTSSESDNSPDAEHNSIFDASGTPYDAQPFGRI